jgi:prolyl oligopeptidase
MSPTLDYSVPKPMRHRAGPRSVAPRFIVSLLLSLSAACASQNPPVTDSDHPQAAVPASEPELRVPDTRRDDVVDTLHGVAVVDPYRWLEDVERDEVKGWMDAQDDVARQWLAARPMRAGLAKRFTELTYIDTVSPPYRRGDRFFYGRSHADKEKGISYYRVGVDGEEKVLLDPNTMSDDGSISVQGVSPSPDGRLVAYKVSRNNADESTMFVRDVDTGKDLEDVIEGVRYGWASWTADGKGFVYTWVPKDAPRQELVAHARVRYHAIGSDPKDDPVVVDPTGDAATFLGAWISQDGHWMFVSKSRSSRNELYFRDLRGKKTLAKGKLVPLATGFAATYGVDTFKDDFFVTTDEGAPRMHVFAVDPARPQRARWKEIVPEGKDQLMGAYVVGGHLVLDYMRNAYTTTHVHDLKGKFLRQIETPALGSTSGMMGREDDDKAYFSFSSYAHKPTIYETSMASGETSVWETIEYPVDTSRIEAEQVWYQSKDGTKVSMFVVKPKGVELDGSHPVLLYGYGGFSSSTTPSFSTRIANWVEHGGIYALPNLRGGGEYGEPWHEAGMRERKQNVFDDFIAAAEFLIEKGYTSPERLAISGGSNGGLLVGAAMVQRPDLFRAVVCAVPLLDMVRYTKFGSGSTWIPEYGDPDVAEDFAFLHAYSPYHHVKQGVKYPALLMLSADSDDRVDPMHARKFVAAIQHASSSGHPAILRIEKNAGHGGADMRKADVEEDADTFAFLMDQLGME